MDHAAPQRVASTADTRADAVDAGATPAPPLPVAPVPVTSRPARTGDHEVAAPDDPLARLRRREDARLPFLDRIQTAFGDHDLGGVRSRQDGAAAADSRAIGASAFTVGSQVSFDGPPDLHTAAHEAAHVVQQRRGAVTAQNERAREREADLIADRVVSGGSAADLLDRVSGTGTPTERVQRKPSDVGKFDLPLTGKLSTLGPQICQHAQMRRLFEEVFPEGDIRRLPELLGLQALVELDEADAVTEITLDRMEGTGRLEFIVKHPLFHIFQNDLFWDDDADKPAPRLFLHKWERVDDGIEGVGLKVFRGMRDAAAALKMEKINCDAIGDPTTGMNPENGYYTWARFGFDNDLSIGKFFERLGQLEDRIASLPEQRQELERCQKIAKDLDVESVDLGEDKRRESLQTWENLDRQGYYHDDRSRAELAFLRQWKKVRDLEAEETKWGTALKYLVTIGPFERLNDLFTKPTTKDGRRMMADLWKGFGSTVMSAVFRLAPESDSNKILADYVDDRSSR